MIVEIRHLRTIAAIAETGSFTRAAKRLHLTLSAVSHQVRELETLLGTVLVERRKQPIALTESGERLLRCAERVLPEVRAAEAEVTMARGRGARLHLALECHSCFEWLLPALDALRPAWPELDIDLKVGPRFDPLPALLAGEVDAVLGTDRGTQAGIAYAGVFRYEIVLVVPKGHPLAGKQFIEPRDLGHEPLVAYPVDSERLDVVTRFLRPAGVEPVRGRTAELTSLLLQLVQSRRGVAALPRWAVADAASRGDIETKKLGRGGLFSDLFLAVREAERGAPHLAAFLEVCRTVSLELLSDIEACADRLASGGAER